TTSGLLFAITIRGPAAEADGASTAAASAAMTMRLIARSLPVSGSPTRRPTCRRSLSPMGDRVIEIRTRTLVRILFTIIAVAVLLEVIWISRGVIPWILIAIFLALALDPLVSFIERRAHVRRTFAIGLSYLAVGLVIVGIGATFVPHIVDE